MQSYDDDNNEGIASEEQKQQAKNLGVDEMGILLKLTR
jgi:hypothetical protein